MGKLWELYLYVVCRLPMSVLPSKHPQLLKYKYKYKEKRVPIMISATTVIENFWEPTSPLTTTAPAKATGWGIAGIASHLKDFIQNLETSSTPKDGVFNHTIPYHICHFWYATASFKPRPPQIAWRSSILPRIMLYNCVCCDFFNRRHYIIVVSIIWLTNRVFWVINIVFWIINRVFSVLCFKADFLLHLLFDVFYHIQLSMFSLVSKLTPCSAIQNGRIP